MNLSDPSLLTEMYGWFVTQLVDRYVHLGTVCLCRLARAVRLGIALPISRNTTEPIIGERMFPHSLDLQA